ncbi:DUF3597 domain-containing protein [Labrys portucalensis]|uniref:DUF3597 domain-containing protein n=1 Tax=Labrys neptuniae TaxID=376174 RepID=A0ABV6ZQR3_9HYPH
MGIFDSISNAIFGRAKAAEAPQAPTGTPSAPTPSSSPAPAPSGSAVPPSTVDVAAVLDQAVKASGQNLDWKRSIVDLLKALKLDSSLAARKELAGELGYTGDTSDSAAMNIWLHKAVIAKLAANGGKVPADLQN